MNTNIGSPMDLFVLQRACKDWIDINRRSMYFYVTSFLSMLCLNFPSFNMYNVIHVWLENSVHVSAMPQTLCSYYPQFYHIPSRRNISEKKRNKIGPSEVPVPHLLHILIFSWNFAWALSQTNIKISSPSLTLCFILPDKWWNFQNMCRGKLPLMLTGGRATLQACEDRG